MADGRFVNLAALFTAVFHTFRKIRQIDHRSGDRESHLSPPGPVVSFRTFFPLKVVLIELVCSA